jgi:hypothetical protein
MKQNEVYRRAQQRPCAIAGSYSIHKDGVLRMLAFILSFILCFTTLMSQSDGYSKLRQQNANALVEQANKLVKTDPNKALSLVESALAVSYEKGDIKAEAEAHFTRGNIHFYQGNHLLAIEAYNKASPLFDRLGLKDRQHKLLNFKALSLEEGGNTAEALEVFRDLYVSTDRDEAGDLLYKIASLEKKLGQTSRADKTYKETYDLAKSTGDTLLMAKVSDVIDQGRDSAAWIGNVQQEVGYYQQQLNTVPQKRSKKAELNYNIGSRYLQQKKPEKAIEYLQNTVELAEKESYVDFEAPEGVTQSNLNIDHVTAIDSIEVPQRQSYDKDMFKVSEEELGRDLEQPIAAKNPGDNPSESERENYSGDSRPKENRKGQPNENSGTSSSKKVINQPAEYDSFLELRSATYRKLAEAYALDRNYVKAWEFGQKALQEADSARKQEIQLLQSAATNREALALREQRIVTLEQDRKLQAEQLRSQRMLNFGLGALLIAIILGGLLLWRIQRKRRRASQLLTLRSLVGQMNPHFIFNSLNTFNSYIATADTQRANRFLGDFSRLMRQVLEYSGHDFVPLGRELEILGLYLKLEHGRFEENFDYEINVSPELDLDAVEIPPMLLQPYVENAIWHGLRYREDKGLLHVDIFSQNNKTFIIIGDNGIGRDKSQALKTHNQQQRSNSLGMKNTARRAELIQSLFKKRLSISVSDQDPEAENPGTKVQLTISD